MVQIEDLVAEHFESVAGWLSSPAISCWLTSQWRDKPVTASTIAIAVRNKRNRMFLVRADGEAAGLVALAEYDAVDRSAEMWYVLSPEAAGGKGTITEAVRLLVVHAFGTLGVRALYLNIMSTNARSQRVAEKAGFRPAGRIRRGMVYRGESVDRMIYDLIPEDLEAKSRPSAGRS